MGDSIVVFPSMIDFSDSQLVLFMAYVFHPLLLQIKAYYRVKICLALFFNQSGQVQNPDFLLGVAKKEPIHYPPETLCCLMQILI